jgi:hypothetical protein
VKRCAILRCHAIAAAVIHRMLPGRKVCAIPAQSCKLAAVMIHRINGGRRGASLPAMQARCCCDLTECLVQGRCLSLRCHVQAAVDPQNALVEGVCYPCAAMQARCCWIHRMLWCKEGCAIPMLSCMQAAVMIHRMLCAGCAIPCAAMHVLLS